MNSSEGSIETGGLEDGVEYVKTGDDDTSSGDGSSPVQQTIQQSQADLAEVLGEGQDDIIDTDLGSYEDFLQEKEVETVIQEAKLAELMSKLEDSDNDYIKTEGMDEGDDGGDDEDDDE